MAVAAMTPKYACLVLRITDCTEYDFNNNVSATAPALNPLDATSTCLLSWEALTRPESSAQSCQPSKSVSSALDPWPSGRLCYNLSMLSPARMSQRFHCLGETLALWHTKWNQRPVPGNSSTIRGDESRRAAGWSTSGESRFKPGLWESSPPPMPSTKVFTPLRSCRKLSSRF